ncbi:hypothetical protein, partial [Burkholderia territorii]|uniref:hypothetical protein n=1 Tax=Burkholderia territorii TaxID=1503055 RepID=UPI001E404240
ALRSTSLPTLFDFTETGVHVPRNTHYGSGTAHPRDVIAVLMNKAKQGRYCAINQHRPGLEGSTERFR